MEKLAYAVMGVGVAAGVVAAVLSLRLRRKRRRELALIARQLGLDYSPTDWIGCLGFPFALLAKGDGRGAENVITGRWQGMDLTEFDYWYYEESSKDGRNRTTYRYSCVVGQIAADCGGLRLDREDRASWLANHVGIHDIQFESEAFNRAFDVQSADRKFANDLVDARMMQWLLTIGGEFRFETAGPYVLCFCPPRSPMDLVPLVGTLKGFVDHVPRVVYELYGIAAGPVGFREHA